MASLYKLANGGANGGVVYSHLLAHPDERERDIIWGGDGNDTIVGDNETWAIYPPDFGFDDWDYQFGNGHPYWDIGYREFDATEGHIDFLLDSLDDQEGDYYFVPYNPYTKTGSDEKYYYDEILIGGDGNDRVYGLAGNDWLLGGAGSDHLYGGADHDQVEGGYGNDFIDVSDTLHEYDVALGQHGDDEITIDLHDYADGGEGAFDKLIVKNVDAPAMFDFFSPINEGSFTKNFELLEFYGSNSNDVVRGGQQNDVLYGNGGSDILEGRFGHDTIDGGAGVDFIYGGRGVDTIHGGFDTDVIYDDEGDDIVFGDDGGDFIWTGEGNDVVHGGSGDDTIDEAGKDMLPNSKNVNDVLFGDGGRDKIYAGTGDDVIDGGADNDLIVGGLGYDQMTGGGDADTFRFRPEDLDRHLYSNGTEELTSLDRIMDFSVKDHDMIDLSGLRSVVPGNKLFFDHNQVGPTEAGEVALSESDGSLWLTVHLDADIDHDVVIKLDGLNFANTTIYAMEQLILI